MKCSSRRLWYHGDTSRRLTFEDQRFQNIDAPNAQGPGIYFTESKNQARGYAWPEGWLYTAHLRPGLRCVSERQRMTPAELQQFVALLDDEGRELLFSNWDEDPRVAYDRIERAYTTRTSRNAYVQPFVSAAADLGRQAGLDYRGAGREWAAMMVRLGYAAFVHEFADLDHLIVWDPRAVVVLDEEYVPPREA